MRPILDTQFSAVSELDTCNARLALLERNKIPDPADTGLLQISAGILVIPSSVTNERSASVHLHSRHSGSSSPARWASWPAACSERISLGDPRQRRCIKLPYMRVSISCLGLYRNMMLLGAFFMCIAGLPTGCRVAPAPQRPADPFATFRRHHTDGEKDFNLQPRLRPLGRTKSGEPRVRARERRKTASVVTLCHPAYYSPVGSMGCGDDGWPFTRHSARVSRNGGLTREDADWTGGDGQTE
ncbi:hypothetical protein BV898_19589 [Hypsibius exemplaris]|uniref:Uncharacterized protein n=1 Tax=Hypsibius exemplaris TaxID=2072580 RepID=A0A9X6NLX1_HYPEX|nr:hypothetical protein BV898_19589 [Hypsibius exemplaris]